MKVRAIGGFMVLVYVYMYVPSQTYYLKRRHQEYLDEQADERKGVDNPSQALQEVLDEHMES